MLSEALEIVKGVSSLVNYVEKGCASVGGGVDEGRTIHHSAVCVQWQKRTKSPDFCDE